MAKVAWPHYFVGDGSGCEWCANGLVWHKWILPRNETTLVGPIPETATRYNDMSLHEVRVAVVGDQVSRVTYANQLLLPVDEVKADHEARKVDANNVAERKAVSPRHYETLVPQPIQVINAWKLNFYFANTIKYVARYGDTGNLDDVKKAKRYLEFFINSVERGDPLADPT